MFFFQLLFAPPFLTFFLGGMEVLKGQNVAGIKQKLNDVSCFLHSLIIDVPLGHSISKD